VVTREAPFSAEQLMALVWNGSENGLIFHDSDGRRILTNEAARRMLSPFDGSSGSRVVLLADGKSEVPRAAWPVTRALAGEIVRGEQIVLCDAHGRQPRRRLMVSAFPVTLPDGRPGALTTFFDVTERWHCEQAARMAVEQLNLLLEGAEGYAIVLLDPDGVVRSWGPNAHRLFGWTDAEIIGRSSGLFFAPADRVAGVPQAVLDEALRNGGAVTEGERLRRDGSRFWAYGVLTTICDTVGEPACVIGVLHDVTARYRAELAVEELNARLVTVNEDLEHRVEERTAELLSSNTELEAFSYSVSHDLRAPIRAVQGFTRMLRQDFPGDAPDEAQHLLRRIEEEAARLGSLVDSLLRLSRMQRQPMTAARVDMADLVTRCWRTIREERPEEPVELDLGPLPDAEGDAELLNQVWMNLLDNAVKFSRGRPNARVEVSAREQPGEVVYRIHDNGAGFDARYADKLFQAFQRLHRDDEFPGIGIGLTVVHRIVLRHGGRVWATGAPGEGATFCFALRKAGHEAA
jgi:PAS domain S-box-containing protein